MTTTMDQMAQVVRLLEAAALRDRFKVIVGGAPLSQQFADRIGADGYAPKAALAVQLAKRLTGLLNVPAAGLVNAT
jgi:methanogenic corrinoid protein MtbC1